MRHLPNSEAGCCCIQDDAVCCMLDDGTEIHPGRSEGIFVRTPAGEWVVVGHRHCSEGIPEVPPDDPRVEVIATLRALAG